MMQFRYSNAPGFRELPVGNIRRSLMHQFEKFNLFLSFISHIYLQHFFNNSMIIENLLLRLTGIICRII